nr:MAG TPA: hypothetical protein [Caudoviricetes sp.]
MARCLRNIINNKKRTVTKCEIFCHRPLFMCEKSDFNEEN